MDIDNFVAPLVSGLAAWVWDSFQRQAPLWRRTPQPLLRLTPRAKPSTLQLHIKACPYLQLTERQKEALRIGWPCHRAYRR